MKKYCFLYRYALICTLLLTLYICLLSGCNVNPHEYNGSVAKSDSLIVQQRTMSSTPLLEPERMRIVVIDPGHQRNGSSELEPLGPGSTEMKARVTDGTTGRYTGLPEYELNLLIAQYLRTELEARGYQVVMTRESHDVDISNRERAQIAEEADGDIFVRIHANGSDDPSKEGAMTICMTNNSPYNPSLYKKSYALSEKILNALVKSTGCAREYVWETDSMSGINWATIPVTIVEVGYMTNEKEDYLLETPEYQRKVVLGIAYGIDEYFRTVEAP